MKGIRLSGFGLNEVIGRIIFSGFVFERRTREKKHKKTGPNFPIRPWEAQVRFYDLDFLG